MTQPFRARSAGFLLDTRPGRLILLAAVVGTLCLLIPGLLARRSRAGVVGTPGNSDGAKDSREAAAEPPAPNGFADTLTLSQSYNALIHRWGSDLAAAKGNLESARKEIDQLRAALEEERTNRSAEKKDLAGILKELRDGVNRQLGPAPSAYSTGPISPPGIAAASAGATTALRAVDLGTPGREKNRSNRSLRIPTASGGRATVLNGVFAPVTGEPSPVRLRLDQVILGPNHARVPLEGTFLIGKAIGDPNALRVSLQIDRLSCVKENGESLESKALGYVVAEDGLEGIPGSYEWRAWEFVPLAAGTGGLQGLSGAVGQAQMTTTLSPLGGATSVLTGSSLKLAGAQAAGGASGKLGDLIAERMKEIRPAISIPAGKIVTVVFLEGVTLDGLDPEELGDDPKRSPYRGLDAPR